MDEKYPKMQIAKERIILEEKEKVIKREKADIF